MKVFVRAAFLLVFSSGDGISKPQHWRKMGEKAQARIRRKGIRCKSRNRYSEKKKKLSLIVKEQLEEVCKKQLELDIHTLELCFRESQYYFLSKVMFFTNDIKVCLSSSHSHVFSFQKLIFFQLGLKDNIPTMSLFKK